MLLNVKTNLKEIDRVCESIRGFCSENNIGEKKCYDIEVIVDELATNVINYAFDDGQEHEFIITLDIKSSEVYIQIIDEGVPFDPLSKLTPDLDAALEERRIGGLGIFFARQLSKDMKYTREDNKNKLAIIVDTTDTTEEK